MSIRRLRDFDKDLLKLHLELHQVLLEVYCLGEAHRLSLRECTTFLHDGSSLWHLQHSEAHLLEYESQLGQGSGLACAGTASQANAGNRVLGLSLLGAGSPTEIISDVFTTVFKQSGCVDNLVQVLNFLREILC